MASTSGYTEIPLRESSSNSGAVVPFAITVALACIGVVGMAANILLLFVLLSKKSRKVTSNFYLVNLAIADLTVSIIVPVRIIDFEGLIFWSPSLCRLQTVLRYFPIFLTIDTMILIAIERHVAVIRPMNFKQFVRRGNVLVQLAVVWILSFVEVAYLVFHCKASTTGICTIIDGVDRTHFVYFLIIVIPTVLLLGIYGHLFVIARLRVQPSSDSKTSQRAVRSARMLLIAAMLFIACWTPTMSLYYEAFLDYPRFSRGPGQKIFQGSSLLIFAHSIMNPIAYTIMSSSFRANAKSALLFWCPGYQPDKENSASITLESRKTNVTAT